MCYISYKYLHREAVVKDGKPDHSTKACTPAKGAHALCDGKGQTARVLFAFLRQLLLRKGVLRAALDNEPAHAVARHALHPELTCWS